MIDTLPATIGFIFQDNGKVVFDLGATERSRADHKIEEYFIDDSTHLRLVDSPPDEPQDEQVFEYRFEGDRLILKQYERETVLTRPKGTP